MLFQNMSKREPLNRIRVLRAERRMTQLSLSRASRINPTRISFIENDLVEATPDERDRIARSLSVTVAEAFPADESMGMSHGG
jgi:transcriptional regulator with XRE-family HTH domain